MLPLMATLTNDLRQMPCFLSRVFIAVIKHDDQKWPEEESSFILVFQITVHPLMEVRVGEAKKGRNLEEEIVVGVIEEWLAPHGYLSYSL